MLNFFIKIVYFTTKLTFKKKIINDPVSNSTTYIYVKYHEISKDTP